MSFDATFEVIGNIDAKLNPVQEIDAEFEEFYGSGGGTDVEPLSVTANGTYTAEEGKAYSPVAVDVPNSYSQSDEGKVVYNSTLVPQTPHTMVTFNGTIDTTINNSVEVAVPLPSGTKDIYVTRNGETTRDVEDYALARIHTDVPNTYTSSDEGKVVSDGELVEQTAHSLVSTNGTVDTTYNNKVVVLVPASAVDVGTKLISANGTHDVVGYASASVNVPNSYSASDEGKVVSNGALASQTAHATVTSNGTVDTTLNNSVQVAVPASAVDSGTKTINTNGTHDVIGYASASVSVPNSYSSSDENKVVHNGALVAQTAHAKVTSNGTIDTTLNNSVQIEVPSAHAKIFTYTSASAVANQDVKVVSADPDVAAHYTDTDAMVTVRKVSNNSVRGTAFIMGSNHTFGVATSLYMNYNGSANAVGTSSNPLTAAISSGVGVYCNSAGDIIVHCASLQNNFGGADYIITFSW